MTNILVLDTCAIISFYQDTFRESSTISNRGLALIQKVVDGNLKAIVPSIVFIELFDLYSNRQEILKKIRYEVFIPLKSYENVEIRPLDKEVLSVMLTFDDLLEGEKFDNHDKQILSCAVVMNCSLVTSDNKIIRYNNRKKLVKEIFA